MLHCAGVWNSPLHRALTLSVSGGHVKVCSVMRAAPGSQCARTSRRVLRALDAGEALPGLALTQGLDPRFLWGKLDFNCLAAMGHSYGGWKGKRCCGPGGADIAAELFTAACDTRCRRGHRHRPRRRGPLLGGCRCPRSLVVRAPARDSSLERLAHAGAADDAAKVSTN